jgi:hypothetical protein
LATLLGVAAWRGVVFLPIFSRRMPAAVACFARGDDLLALVEPVDAGALDLAAAL